jgi:flagellar biosynthesis/type III secretory pathway protein FliH
MTRVIRNPARARGKRLRHPSPELVRVLKAEQLRANAVAEQTLARAADEAEQTRQAADVAAENQRKKMIEGAQAEAVALLVSARGEAVSIVEQARDDLTRLAVRIAEKLLGAELTLRPEAVTQLVSQCLKAVGTSHRMVIRVNPRDVDTLEKAVPRLRGAVEAQVLLIEADPNITAGGCMVETEHAQLDGRIETQLARLLEALASSAKQATP